MPFKHSLESSLSASFTNSEKSYIAITFFYSKSIATIFDDK